MEGLCLTASSNVCLEKLTSYMDELWRIPIGTIVPRRRSTEENLKAHHHSLKPEDFSGVFGGPPHTVLLQCFSGGLSTSSNTSSNTHPVREEVFRPSSGRGGGVLQNEEVFYDDIFGSRGGTRDRRGRSRAKLKLASSSSILSSEDLGAFRADTNQDAMLPSFTSKLSEMSACW